MSAACPSCRAEGSGEGEERQCEKRVSLDYLPAVLCQQLNQNATLTG